MADVPVHVVSIEGGADPTYAAVNNGDTFVNDGKNTFFYIKNANASTVTVTFVGSGECDQGALHNQVKAILTTEERIFGPFPFPRFGGTVTVNYDLTPSVTSQAFKLLR